MYIYTVYIHHVYIHYIYTIFCPISGVHLEYISSALYTQSHVYISCIYLVYISSVHLECIYLVYISRRQCAPMCTHVQITFIDKITRMLAYFGVKIQDCFSLLSTLWLWLCLCLWESVCVCVYVCVCARVCVCGCVHVRVYVGVLVWSWRLEMLQVRL